MKIYKYPFVSILTSFLDTFHHFEQLPTTNKHILLALPIYMLKCSTLFQLVETTNICKIGFKSFAHIHVHENLGGEVGEKTNKHKEHSKGHNSFPTM
jgi:hypothetical protein